MRIALALFAAALLSGCVVVPGSVVVTETRTMFEPAPKFPQPGEQYQDMVHRGPQRATTMTVVPGVLLAPVCSSAWSYSRGRHGRSSSYWQQCY